MNKKEGLEQAESYQITDLDQVKALAHPLRMRIIETLAAADPMTTKQVAEELGEKPTRLYHHVDMLQKTGLIRLTHTRQNRGTTEKYYEAIAKQFRAGADLFSDDASDDKKDAFRPMIQTVFDHTLSEMLRLVESEDFEDKLDEEGLLSYLEIHVPQDKVDVVQRKLKELLEYIQELGDSEYDDEEIRKYRLLIAHYPLDRFK